jgi:hypothetical protein
LPRLPFPNERVNPSEIEYAGKVPAHRAGGPHS